MAILTEIKADTINGYIAKINNNFEDFALRLNEHKRNSTYMRIFIAKFLVTYEVYSYERLLILHVNDAISGSSSLINVYIRFLRGVGYQETYDLRSTTNKYIYDFFVSIMLVVGKGHALRELAQILEESYSGGNLKLNKKHSDYN